MKKYLILISTIILILVGCFSEKMEINTDDNTYDESTVHEKDKEYYFRNKKAILSNNLLNNKDKNFYLEELQSKCLEAPINKVKEHKEIIYQTQKAIQEMEIAIKRENDNFLEENNSIGVKNEEVMTCFPKNIERGEFEDKEAKRGENSSFSRSKALIYSRTYAVNYNSSKYPYLAYMGGDCANFASQTLLAGGMLQDSTWYIKAKKNNPNTIPKNVSELNGSWSVANPSPWISAKQFTNYWKKKSYKFETYYADSLLADMYYPYNVLWMNDIVQILKKDFWGNYQGYHTMVVTGLYSKNGNYDIYLSYHTAGIATGKEEMSLSEILKQYNTKEYVFALFRVKKNGI